MLRELVEIVIAAVIVIALERFIGEWPTIAITFVLWIATWKKDLWR